MKSITLYVEDESYISRLHPYTKLLYILAAVSIPLIIDRMQIFGMVILCSTCILASVKMLKKTIPLFAFSITLLVTIFLIQGLFNPRNSIVLWQIGPVCFYKEGVLYACKLGLNIINMLLALALFVFSTKPSDLVDAMEKTGFSKRFGYIINSVFQIIPQMMGTAKTITDAQRSRGMETEGKLIVRAKAIIPLMAPVVISSLINTRERAIALEVRGFEAKCKKTFLYDRKRNKLDYILTTFLITLMIVSIVVRIFS